MSVAAGGRIYASDLNALEFIYAAYTPSWISSGTAPALGNGTLTGRYKRQGDLVAVHINLTTGSTTTYGTGAYTLTLPVGGIVGQLLGVQVKDASAGARYSGQVELVTTDGAGMRMNVGSSTSNVGATVPMTFASGDQILISGIYEVA